MRKSGEKGKGPGAESEGSITLAVWLEQKRAQ